ncbi:hypothetical protein M0802_006710 [Mischocyttarus mexicanus]|nr:hypothetical protein M0802_006710 [Mischocyttarus mexicanus]
MHIWIQCNYGYSAIMDMDMDTQHWISGQSTFNYNVENHEPFRLTRISELFVRSRLLDVKRGKTYGARPRKNGVDGAEIVKTGDGNEAHRYTT